MLQQGYKDGSGMDKLTEDGDIPKLAIRWGCGCCKPWGDMPEHLNEYAQRIVTAVNCHDELVSALRALICDYTCQVPKSKHNPKTRELIRQALSNAK